MNRIIGSHENYMLKWYLTPNGCQEKWLISVSPICRGQVQKIDPHWFWGARLSRGCGFVDPFPFMRIRLHMCCLYYIHTCIYIFA